MGKRQRTAPQLALGHSLSEGVGQVLSDPGEAPQDFSKLPQPRPRKRSLDSEDDRLRKRRRADLKLASEHTSGEAANQTLSKRNLRRLQRSEQQHGEDLILDWMDMDSNTSGSVGGGRGRVTKRRGNKGPSRSQSRKSASTTTNLTKETPSQQSQKANSNTDYRYYILEAAQIYIEFESPPDPIQNRIDAIIGKETAEERKKELAGFAQTLCMSFTRVLRRWSDEDDCLGLLFQTLSAMDHRARLVLARKAGMIFQLSSQVSVHVIMLTLYQNGYQASNPWFGPLWTCGVGSTTPSVTLTVAQSPMRQSVRLFPKSGNRETQLTLLPILLSRPPLQPTY